jgi:hypothetical protein
MAHPTGVVFWLLSLNPPNTTEGVLKKNPGMSAKSFLTLSKTNKPEE